MNLTAKQYLQGYLSAERRIGVHLRAIARLRESVAGSSGAMGDRVKSSTKDSMALSVEKIVDLEREIEAEERRQAEIKAAVQRVTDEKLRDVLDLKYIRGMTLEQTARAMGYSHDRIRHLHLDALEALEKRGF